MTLPGVVQEAVGMGEKQRRPGGPRGD
jgi:hypothetical protein